MKPPKKKSGSQYRQSPSIPRLRSVGGREDNPTSDVRYIQNPNEALVTPEGITVSPVSSGPTIARPESATVPPANSGGAIRVDREPGGRPTARRLDLQGDKVQTTVDDESDESYAAVLSGNRQAENGMLLEYVAPDMDEECMCVCFSDDDIAEELEKWKHSLVMYVIGVSHTLVYMKAWVLLALLSGDGKIEAEVKLTGILSLGALQPGESRKYGTTIAPELYAPLHQHFFVARMDMSVDCKPGEMHNQVVEVNVRVEEPGKDNVHNNAFYAEETLLRSELEAMRDCDPLSARHCIIRNTRTINRSGQLTGFKLVPGSNCLPLAGPEAKFMRRAAFLKHSLWVTQYARGEDFSGGEFPNQNPRAGEGLVSWVKQNRPLEETDVVLCERVIRLPWLERGNQSCHERSDAGSKGDDEVFAEISTCATAFQLLCGHEHDILSDSELDMNVMMDRCILGRTIEEEEAGKKSLAASIYVLVLLICVTKVAKSASDKALAEHEDIDDAVGSEESTEHDHGMDLQQPLLIKIDSSDSHKK
ncbi:hypothetical protein OROHE_006288 [Orobanche hederae]